MATLAGAITCGVTGIHIAGALEKICHLRQSLCKRSRTHVITGIAFSSHICIQGCSLFKKSLVLAEYACTCPICQTAGRFCIMQAMAEGLLHLFSA